MEEQRRLYRSRDEKMISGVCGGIAEYFETDPTLVRVIAVLLLVLGNAVTVVVYLLMAVILPEAPIDPAAAPAAPAVPPMPGDAAPSTSATAQYSATPDPQPAADPAPAPPSAAPPSATAAGHRAPRAHHAHAGGGLGLGLVLITIGVVMLVARFNPQFGLWNLWPLVIVIAGLVQAVTPGREGWGVERFFDGLVTAAFGGVFLAITFGYVGWGVWWRVLALWPALVIAIGLGILGAAVRQSWVKALGSVVIIAALGLAIMSVPAKTPLLTTASGKEFSFHEQRGAIESAELSLKAGVGEIQFGAAENDLVRIDGVTPFSDPAFEVARTGEKADVAFSMGDADGVVVWPGSPGARVDAKLSPDVAWNAKVDAGVCTVDADLSDVPLRGLVFSTGLADARLRLGEPAKGAGRVPVVVKAGLSSVTIRVPEDAEVRVEADTGLSSIDVSGLDESGGRVWKTEGYDAARSAGRDVWDVRIEAGMGSVQVRTY